ncbi:MAG: hypothetical protein Q8L23_04115 [Caulobacter sp.]|nr:hypothetical protein [Caulobacter sp.]
MSAGARTPSRVTLAALIVLGLINLARGSIHAFLPDSGAGVIAGFDLSQGGATIIFLLAAIGAGQIGSGLVDLLVATRYRAFAVPLLGIELLRNLIGLYLAFVSKPAPTDFPGEKGLVAGSVVMAAVLVWEFARRRRPV